MVAKSSPDSQQVEMVEGQSKRRSGSRGTVRRIQRAARERQAAWAETDQPTTTLRPTRELFGLYGEHRDEQAGTLTDPYHGRTSKAGRG